LLTRGEEQAVRLVRALSAGLDTDQGTMHWVTQQLGYGTDSCRFRVKADPVVPVEN